MILYPKARRVTFLLFLCLLALSTSVIWVRTETVKKTYEYVRKEKDFRQLQQENQELRIQWLKLTSPQRLEKLARTYELRPPRIGQVLKYEPERQKILTP